MIYIVSIYFDEDNDEAIEQRRQRTSSTFVEWRKSGKAVDKQYQNTTTRFTLVELEESFVNADAFALVRTRLK